MTLLSKTLLSVLFVAAASGWFLLSTVLMDRVSKPWIVAAAAAAAALMAVVAGLPTKASITSLGTRRLLSSVLAGILMIAVAPLLVLTNRLSDAPPGSEVIFFTTAVWGITCVLLALAIPRARSVPGHLAFALAGLLGSASVLANWERPSSFSPLVRYPNLEIAFMVAGVVWALGTLLLLSASRPGDRSTPVGVAAVSGAVAAVSYAFVTSGFEALLTARGTVGVLVVLSTAFGALFVSWAMLTRDLGLARPAGLWFLPAVAITALGVVEQAIAPKGPDPVIWAGAIAGAALALLGGLGVLLLGAGSRASAGRAHTPGRLGLVARLLALAVLVGGAVSLAFPAFDASVKGTLSNQQDYSAAWTMLGYESAGGWIPLVAGALLLSGALEASTGRWRPAFAAAIGGFAAIATYPVLAHTPLHTWNRWVPVEIQAEYGTEYTLLEMIAVHDPVRLAVLGVGVAAAFVLLVLSLMIAHASTRKPAPASEVVE